MGKNTFDAVLASVPNGATAGRVTSKGTHYTPQMNAVPTRSHWDAPPKMRPVPATSIKLVGRKFGKLTVFGLWDDTDGGPRRDAKAKWVVRCACGDYEIRTAKAINNPANNEDACRICRDFVRKQRNLKVFGSRPVGDFFVSVK